MKPRVFLGNQPHRVGQVFANLGRGGADFFPLGVVGNVKPNEAVVFLDDFESGFTVAVNFGEPFQFIIENIGQSANEYQRQDVVLVFGCIHRTSQTARRLPKPIFQLFDVHCRVSPVPK